MKSEAEISEVRAAAFAIVKGLMKLDRARPPTINALNDKYPNPLVNGRKLIETVEKLDGIKNEISNLRNMSAELSARGIEGGKKRRAYIKIEGLWKQYDLLVVELIKTFRAIISPSHYMSKNSMHPKIGGAAGLLWFNISEALTEEISSQIKVENTAIANLAIGKQRGEIEGKNSVVKKFVSSGSKGGKTKKAKMDALRKPYFKIVDTVYAEKKNTYAHTTDASLDISANYINHELTKNKHPNKTMTQSVIYKYLLTKRKSKNKKK